MNTRRDQTIGAIFFLLLILLGWAPFFVETATKSMYDAPAILLGGFFAILAAGLTYDAAERLFGTGKGIYCIAVLTSFIPAAIVMSEPPLLAASSIMFISAATLWFAARATKDSAHESLFFIAILSGLALAVYGLWPAAFLPLVAQFILRERARVSTLALLVSLLPIVAGFLLKSSNALPLPDIAAIKPDISVSVAESIVFMSTWIPWLLGAFLLSSAVLQALWPRLAIVLIAAMILLNASLESDWLVLMGAAGPLVALITTAVIAQWFAAETNGKLRALRWMALPAILALCGMAVARFLHSEQLLLTQNHAVLALLLAVLVAVAIVRDARRVIFALQVASGLLIGVIWWRYVLDGGYESLPEEISIVPWILVIVLFLRAIERWIYGRRMPRAQRAAVSNHSFESARFRKFENVRRATWEGAPVHVSLDDPAHVRFAIFGDVAGSEFPLSSRDSGYYAFREIVDELNRRKPDFIVSTGDLAARATHRAYRRLRMLLRRVSSPLIVTPGNHDYVNQGVVHAQFFRALFGSDHGDLIIGPLRLILINNSWGSFADEQLTWINETLAKPTTASYTLVFCHKPVIDPRPDTYYGMEHRPHAEFLMKLFAEHNVTAVFSGHIHSLLVTEQDGVNYIISGGGGSKLKSEQDTHHYLWCETTEDSLNVTAHVPGQSEPLLQLRLPRRA